MSAIVLLCEAILKRDETVRVFITPYIAKSFMLSNNESHSGNVFPVLVELSL